MDFLDICIKKDSSFNRIIFLDSGKHLDTKKFFKHCGMSSEKQ
jgi:hypothetical protein